MAFLQISNGQACTSSSTTIDGTTGEEVTTDIPITGVHIKQFAVLTIGETYIASLTISNWISGTVNMVGTGGTAQGGNGIKEFVFVATGVDFEIIFDNFVGCVDDIVVSAYTNNPIFYIADLNGKFITYINSASSQIVDGNLLYSFQWDYQDLSPGCYKICCLDQCANTNEQNDLNIANNGGDWHSQKSLFDPVDDIAPHTITYDQNSVDFIVFLDAAGSASFFTYKNNLLTTGVKYRFEFDLNMDAGVVQFSHGSGLGLLYPADNGHIVYDTEVDGVNYFGGVNFTFFKPGAGNANISITNFKITVHPDSFVADFCSQPLQLTNEEGCTKLLRWFNKENAFGFKYPTAFYFYMRVAGKLWKDTFKKQKEVFRKSNGEQVVTVSESNHKEKLSIEEIPVYMHKALSLGIDHDFFIIGGDHYVADSGDYEPDYRNSNGGKKAPITIEVEKNFQQNLRNDNCD